MNESWKNVTEFDDVYQVSNLGNVRKLVYEYNEDGSVSKVNVVPAQTNRVGWGKYKYLAVPVKKDGCKTLEMLHRMVAKAFIPNHNNYSYVIHLDDNNYNNAVTNLKWVRDASKGRGGADNTSRKKVEKTMEKENMTTENIAIVTRAAVRQYGDEAQIMKAIEELSELIKELAKYDKSEDSLNRISEEMADVQIMLHELILIFNNGDDVQDWQNRKLERLKKRLFGV